MSEMHDLAAPYVLGALDRDELEGFEAHLDDCKECHREVTRLGEGVMDMVVSGAIDPPAHLRDQVIAATKPQVTIERAPAKRDLARVFIPALAVIAVVVVAIVVVFRTDPVEDILAAPDAVSLPLTITDAYAAEDPQVARVVFSAERGLAAVEFSGLADPGPGTEYQLWLIDEDGPSPAGTFTPSRDGDASIALVGVATAGQVVGITEEPEGGLDAPTGEVLFVAEL